MARGYHLQFLFIVALVTSACASASAPAPTAAPAKPAQATAIPTAAPAQAAPTKPAAMNKLDEYYQRAKSAGEMKIIHYGGGVGSEYEPVAAAFRQKYPGAEVEMVNLRGPELIQRLTAEASSGKHIANIASAGATTMLGVEQPGFLAEWEGPPNVADLPELPLTAGKTRWGYSEGVYGIIWNTDLVPADKLPRTRQDLLDPFWKGKGKLLIEDPRAGGPGIEFFTLTLDELGPEYLEKIKAQEPTFVRERDAAPAQIARGEYAMFLPVSITRELFDMAKNAPVKVGWLEDGGATNVTVNLGVVKNAPGQDIAKLYVSFWTSEEGQKLIAEKVQVYAALRSAPPPPGWPSLNEIKPQRRTSDQIKRNNEYAETFDKLFFK
ncbi:MAG: ABC transporter substrate-binding protein [Chloroflexota bacterium]